MLYLSHRCKLNKANNRSPSIVLGLRGRESLVFRICVILLAQMDKNDDNASAGRLQRFAEIYREKMKAHPYMEILARYDSMTEAGLLVRERVKADLYLDTHRLNELLYPAVKIKLVGEN